MQARPNIQSTSKAQDPFGSRQAHLEYPTGLRLTYGPCRSRPAVLVLRHQWERHPAALLSVKRDLESPFRRLFL